MKIMHFDASREWSGGANRVLLFSKELSLRGHQSVVCCLPASDMSRRLEREELPFFTIDLRSDINLLTLPGIVEKLYRHDIDIIDIHSPKFYWLGLLAARIAGLPVVITRNVPFRKTGFKRAANRFLYRSVDRVIAISDKIKRELVADYRLAEHTIDVIHDGLELDRFLPGKRHDTGSRRGIVTIGVVSRLVRGKGLECFIDAIPLIAARIPESRFLVVGSGIIEAELRCQAEALQVADRITFTGFSNDVPALLATMDLTVMPSPEEGMSMSALESMASGVPVVATTGGGLVDIIRNMENGVVVPPCDPLLLADAVIGLLNADRQLIGGNARQVIEEKFALGRVAEHYEQLLGSFVGSRS